MKFDLFSKLKKSFKIKRNNDLIKNVKTEIRCFLNRQTTRTIPDVLLVQYTNSKQSKFLLELIIEQRLRLKSISQKEPCKVILYWKCNNEDYRSKVEAIFEVVRKYGIETRIVEQKKNDPNEKDTRNILKLLVASNELDPNTGVLYLTSRRRKIDRRETPISRISKKYNIWIARPFLGLPLSAMTQYLAQIHVYSWGERCGIVSKTIKKNNLETLENKSDTNNKARIDFKLKKQFENIALYEMYQDYYRKEQKKRLLESLNNATIKETENTQKTQEQSSQTIKAEEKNE